MYPKTVEKFKIELFFTISTRDISYSNQTQICVNDGFFSRPDRNEYRLEREYRSYLPGSCFFINNVEESVDQK